MPKYEQQQSLHAVQSLLRQEDEDELYNVSVRIRSKLEDIERQATPLGSAYAEAQEATRLRRAARRHVLREGTVRVQKIGVESTPFVAAGVLLVATEEVPARDLVHKPIPTGREILLSLGDAVILAEGGVEDWQLRVLNPDELSKQPALRALEAQAAAAAATLASSAAAYPASSPSDRPPYSSSSLAPQLDIPPMEEGFSKGSCARPAEEDFNASPGFRRQQSIITKARSPFRREGAAGPVAPPSAAAGRVVQPLPGGSSRSNRVLTMAPAGPWASMGKQGPATLSSLSAAAGGEAAGDEQRGAALSGTPLSAARSSGGMSRYPGPAGSPPPPAGAAASAVGISSSSALALAAVHPPSGTAAHSRGGVGGPARTPASRAPAPEVNRPPVTEVKRAPPTEGAEHIQGVNQRFYAMWRAGNPPGQAKLLKPTLPANASSSSSSSAAAAAKSAFSSSSNSSSSSSAAATSPPALPAAGAASRHLPALCSTGVSDGVAAVVGAAALRSRAPRVAAGPAAGPPAALAPVAPAAPIVVAGSTRSLRVTPLVNKELLHKEIPSRGVLAAPGPPPPERAAEDGAVVRSARLREAAARDAAAATVASTAAADGSSSSNSSRVAAVRKKPTGAPRSLPPSKLAELAEEPRWAAWFRLGAEASIPAWALAERSRPWLHFPPPLAGTPGRFTYEGHPIHVPLSLKFIDERSYVDGYSIERAVQSSWSAPPPSGAAASSAAAAADRPGDDIEWLDDPRGRSSSSGGGGGSRSGGARNGRGVGGGAARAPPASSSASSSAAARGAAPGRGASTGAANAHPGRRPSHLRLRAGPSDPRDHEDAVEDGSDPGVGPSDSLRRVELPVRDQPVPPTPSQRQRLAQQYGNLHEFEYGRNGKFPPAAASGSGAKRRSSLAAPQRPSSLPLPSWATVPPDPSHPAATAGPAPPAVKPRYMASREWGLCARLPPELPHGLGGAAAAAKGVAQPPSLLPPSQKHATAPEYDRMLRIRLLRPQQDLPPSQAAAASAAAEAGAAAAGAAAPSSAGLVSVRARAAGLRGELAASGSDASKPALAVLPSEFPGRASAAHGSGASSAAPAPGEQHPSYPANHLSGGYSGNKRARPATASPLPAINGTPASSHPRSHPASASSSSSVTVPAGPTPTGGALPTPTPLASQPGVLSSITGSLKRWFTKSSNPGIPNPSSRPVAGEGGALGAGGPGDGAEAEGEISDTDEGTDRATVKRSSRSGSGGVGSAASPWPIEPTRSQARGSSANPRSSPPPVAAVPAALQEGPSRSGHDTPADRSLGSSSYGRSRSKPGRYSEGVDAGALPRPSGNRK